MSPGWGQDAVPPSPEGMHGRVVVVTGANSGIGLETSRALAALGARVVMMARDERKGRAAVEDVRRTTGSDAVELALVDLARMDSVRAAAAELLARYPQIHVLVNNAGLVLARREVTVDGFEAMFAINHLGPFLLTALLLERLKASAPARIVNVSSAVHRYASMPWDDLMAERGFFSAKQYCRTKLANVLHVAELARRFDGTGITANALHPGPVGSGFARGGDMGALGDAAMAIGRMFLLTPAQGARTSVYLASSSDVEGVSGRYFVKLKAREPSRAARDAEAARRLWDVSCAWLGLPA